MSVPRPTTPSTPSPLATSAPRVIALIAVLIAALLVAGTGSDMPRLNAQTPPRLETTRTSPIPLNPGKGAEIGAVYEAYLSPQQEGGEESETPALIPSTFRSTAPSVPRNERPDRGHAVIAFNNELSKAYVYLSITDVKVEDIVMLHLHCGRPAQLGPILVDFALIGDVLTYLADGSLSLEVTNEDIVATTAHSHGLIGAFTIGCPIVPTIPNDRVRTIAGMELIARQGDLYFNLHTKGQTYFGDIRGQFVAANVPVE